MSILKQDNRSPSKKQLQKAFAYYVKNGNLKPLSSNLIKLIMYMAKEAKEGYEIRFLNTLPSIVDFLDSMCLVNSKGNRSVINKRKKKEH